jgi:hypothetical protein
LLLVNLFRAVRLFGKGESGHGFPPAIYFLRSCNGGSFLKSCQFSATSLQLSTVGRAAAFRCPPALQPAAFRVLLRLLLCNGGFVPDSAKARSFVINQIGGFVFKKALSFQPSVVRFQLLVAPVPSADCLLPTSPLTLILFNHIVAFRMVDPPPLTL